MPQNVFKIYDGRTGFWQWDTKQKLIVLDDRITEVRFSNKNTKHSKRRLVYTDNNDVRVCSVPDSLLQSHENLIAYACINEGDGIASTVKEVRFAVRKQQMPSDYTYEEDSVIDDIISRIELLENLMEDVTQGSQEMKKFDNIDDASQWAMESGKAGDIIVVKLDAGWVPHIIEDDKSLTSIHDYSGNTFILEDDNGNELIGVVVEQETIFTATASDIVKGKVAATDNGVVVGTHEC